MAIIAFITQTRRLKTAAIMSRAEVSARAIAALAASLALVGCSTPFLQSSVDVPSGFAQATVAAVAEEPEVAWWESYRDPVLSDLVRRAARENRCLLYTSRCV